MNVKYSFSSSVGLIISRYLILKQALGRQYIAEYAILKHLDLFLNTTHSDLTSESFTAWCYTQ